jgi:hypothetical protein
MAYGNDASGYCKCTKCGISLILAPIPESSYEDYGYNSGDLCKYQCGNFPHYTKMVSVYNAKNNTVTHYQCSSCDTRWEA